jgi:hypothetical protein
MTAGGAPRVCLIAIDRWISYLVRHCEGQLDLVGHGISVCSALDRETHCGRACPEGRPSEPDRVHCAMDGGRK